MKANSLPKVLRDILGRLPGDPERRSRLKTLLQPAMLATWEVGQTADFTDEEIGTALAELLDEEVVCRLANELAEEQARFDRADNILPSGKNDTRRPPGAQKFRS